ncbi:hypothetical protein J6590_105679, partial [Homalodisca vitripennis]
MKLRFYRGNIKFDDGTCHRVRAQDISLTNRPIDLNCSMKLGFYRGNIKFDD